MADQSVAADEICIACDGDAEGRRVDFYGSPEHGDPICGNCAERYDYETFRVRSAR